MKYFRLCFDSGKIPKEWRKAIICPIYKGKGSEPRLPSSYRGISLLSCIYKLYSSVLNTRLRDYLEYKGTLAEEQNGFRKKRSCEEHIYILNSIIRNSLDNKKSIYAAFIDFKTAFDVVDRHMLLYKIIDAGVDGKLYFAIKEIYKLTEASVRINGEFTNWFTVNNGVRQGDTLSTTLFLIYINDLAKHLNDLGLGIDINGRKLSTLFYADDIVLFTDNPHELQSLLDVVHDWCKRWKLAVNFKKSNVIHFRNKRTSRTEIQFKLGNNDVSYTASYKYLGIYMNEFLDYNYTAEQFASSAERALGSIINKYKRYPDMGYSTYTKLYENCVAPILDYSSGIWGYKTFSKIESLQNRAQRIFLGVHRFAPALGVEGDMGWLLRTNQRRLKMLQFWNRLVKMRDTRLTKKVFRWEYSNGRHNWCSEVLDIFRKLNLEFIYENFMMCDIRRAEEQLRDLENTEWKESVLHKPKLRLYRQIKDSKGPDYFTKINLTRMERSLLSQFRLGILPIEIETGRYRQKPVDERKCPFCKVMVEDELHFLFDCPCYDDIRNQTLIFDRAAAADLEKRVGVLKELVNDNPRQIAKFILQSFRRRTFLLNK